MYTVIWMYNSIPGKELSVPLASLQEVTDFCKWYKHEHHERFADPKLDLGIRDCSTGRIRSHRRLVQQQVHRSIAHLGAVCE